jgi:aminobenzoyl-glutamate utilization protein B
VYANKALAELIFENIKAVGRPKYTEEEVIFAKTLQESMELPVKGVDYPLELLDGELEPYRGGSSDVGDVTLVVPCATIRFPSRITGKFPGHHWSIATCGISSYAHKGISAGAKAASYTVYDLLTKPELLKPVKKEFRKLNKAFPYKTFLPDDAEPPLGWNSSLMGKYRSEMEKYYITP